ncbi:hypothetical protein FOZ61_007437 [Perkinsus olseni]|uniref:Uncharacterized protein n=1 Tax=Perkinsus olseni TaxID=32597 RepID=A0A7J6L923_PEROL|nr:hypothetical protein FOZ61_007437 [Perkinsus olseni]
MITISINPSYTVLECGHMLIAACVPHSGLRLAVLIDSLWCSVTGWSVKKSYPFAGEYLCKSAKIGRIRVEDTPEDYITFFRKSNDSLPKPSYGCEFTAYLELVLWRLNLRDACEALIKDSGGYYDQRILRGIFAIVYSGLLGVPQGLLYEGCSVVG